MLEKKYLAPNAITAASLFLGFLSITTSFKGEFNKSILFIIIAMICDGLDGKAARKFDAFSEFGKEFDSFADAISFGLAPGFLIYCKLQAEVANSTILVPVSFLYAFCGVMRLVKFNVITVASSEKGDFSGMPIPNAAAMVCSYVLISRSLEQRFGFRFYDREFFIGISLLAAILMVSTISFKTPEKTFSFIPRKLIPVVIVGAAITAYYSIFILSGSYVILNLYRHIRNSFGVGDEGDGDLEEEEKTPVVEYLPLIPKEKPAPGTETPKAAGASSEPAGEKPKEEKEKPAAEKKKSPPRTAKSGGPGTGAKAPRKRTKK
jgi:CDP-diacylglycerol--serine O-phosphatidyltransferase